MLTLAFNIQPVKASETLYIDSDYTFTSNIYEPIVVTADNITIDGNGYTLKGFGSGTGFYLEGRSNVTIKNVIIEGWDDGIYLIDSSNNSISGNNITNNWRGIYLWWSSNYNTISGNNITNNGYGIRLWYSSNNKFYHNNLVNNRGQVNSDNYVNAWDDGYPSGGNYWSDYTGVDVKSGPNQDQPSSDGIGDTAYVIDENNQDNYPFMDPNGWLLHQLTQLTITSSPVIGIAFTIEGIPETTPYTRWLLEGSYTLIMPETHNGYVWSHWLEDGDPNRTKTITLPDTTWIGVFVFAVQPHGPEAEFTATPDTASTGESIKFDASSSLPGWNGTHTMPITEYRWDFGDGNQTTTFTPIVYHSFSSSGIYYVALTMHPELHQKQTQQLTK